MSFRRLGLRGPFLFGVGAVLAACASATGTGEEEEPRGRPGAVAGAAGTAGNGGSAGKAASAGKAGSAGAIGIAGQTGDAGTSSGGAGAAGAPAAGSGGALAAGAAGVGGTAGAAGKAGGAGASGAAGTSGASATAGAGGGGQGGSAGKAGAGGTAGSAGGLGGKAGSSGGGGEAGRAGASGASGNGGSAGVGGATAGTGGAAGSAGQSGSAGAGGGTIPIVCHDPCVAGPPMDLTCPDNGIIVDACGANGVGNKDCCTTGWSDACVAFTDAVIGCAGRSSGYQACMVYQNLPAPADSEGCSDCRASCYDLAECGGGIFGDTQLQVECDPPLTFPPTKNEAVCNCLLKPAADLTKGCFGRKGAACCLSEGAVARCLATTCKTECAQ